MWLQGNLDMRRVVGQLAGYGLWAAILVVAFGLQVVPVLLVVTMFGLAVGLSVGVELVAVPLVVLAAVLTACLIAPRRPAQRRRRIDALPRDRRADFQSFKRVR